MGIIIWVLQGIISFIFLYSGLNKTYFDEEALVEKGQTGVEGLNKWFIKFIGFSEILGSVALILPLFYNKWLILSPISAICLGAIMIPAAFIHYSRNELKNVAINIIIFIVCGVIAWYRIVALGN